MHIVAQKIYTLKDIHTHTYTPRNDKRQRRRQQEQIVREMSQRALKKREHSLQKQEKETHQIYRKQVQPFNAQQKSTKYTQRTANPNSNVLSKSFVIKSNQIDSNRSNISVCKQKFHSTPNLAAASSLSSILSTSDSFRRNNQNQLVRSHSESDLSCMPAEANVLMNAKSEFHLKSIASTQVSTQNFQPLTTSTPDHSFNLAKKNITAVKQPMDTTARNIHAKRMSIQSGHSSQTAGSMTSSASDSTQPPTVGFCDPDNIRIPIIGYEVMEERARFTVK